MAMKNNEQIEQRIAEQVVDREYTIAKSNRSQQNDDFEASIDMLECERTEKEVDWRSDIFIPEFPSQILTQSALDAAQYFQTREFVETYLEDGSDEAQIKADASKECINRTLNQKHLHYYQKFLRARINNNLAGQVFARCWWEQETKTVMVNERQEETLGVDEFGNEITSESQIPARRINNVPVETEVATIDRFNFDIIDQRNIFMDNNYAYNIQQKEWITIRFERTYHELLKDKAHMGYINLDKLKETTPSEETETSSESYNKDDGQQKTTSENMQNRPFDILERHGKFWVKILKRDENGNPTKIAPGINVEGEPLKNAEYIETIITYAIAGTKRIMIRFQIQPYTDFNGIPFKPIIRGLCYIHPTKDSGLGDGKYARELQVAINDTFNISNDRVLLATLPTFKGKKFALEDNTEIYFKPQHTIPLENIDDLVEFKISDDISGALQQIGMLVGKMNQVSAVYPPTMGQLPDLASTTATAVAGAESKSNVRSNYKSLTFEHTFLNDLYWMILQMTWQFAKPETGMKLMGDKVFDFDPDGDYIYKPLSQSIEDEYSKANQRKEAIQLMSYVAQIPNPKTPMLVNFLLARIFSLSGDEYEKFKDILLDEQAPMGKGIEQTEQGGPGTSNQSGVPMSTAEQTIKGVQ